MEAENSTFSLKGGDSYITRRESDAFRVKSGSVLIYIVPVKSGTAGRRSFLYEAQPGELIPSFVYKDMEYCEWRFCFVALEAAEIEILPDFSTKVLREKFAVKAGVRNFKVEGYNGSLVDQYRINTVTEDGFIRRSQQERENTSRNILRLIYSAFHHADAAVAGMERTNNPLYNAMALLCAKGRTPIAPFEKMREACGDKYSVADIARLSHFSYREIVLSPGWRTRDSGSFLVFDQQNKPYACLSRGGSYVLCNPEDGVLTPVSAHVEQSLSAKAYMIYRPLPSGQITGWDIFSFCRKSILPRDLIWLMALSLITALVGLLAPTISQKLYDQYIPLGEKIVLLQIGCLMGSFMIANVLFSIVKNLVNFRITSRMAYDTQSAVYDRLFKLPESFFRNYESADLAQRVMGAGNIIHSMAVALFSIGVAGVFVLIYFLRMFSYSGELTALGLAMVAVYGGCYYLISSKGVKYQQASAELEGKTNSIMFQFLTGISKIRIAGVEDRALYEYMKPYVELRESEFKRNKIGGYGDVISLLASSLFSILLYIIVIQGKLAISLGAFIAFTSVFGAFTAYALQIVQSLVEIKGVGPLFERLKPVLAASPELDDAKELPGEISGVIEINNVVFSYSNDGPDILSNVSLNIKPGEYIGIVGPSGCGKSTLMKLLLGFEKPRSGKIYYDNKDIENLDKRELRKKIGVVLQDGKLISGSIFENITITAPSATLSDVQRVVKAVGLEKDINEMPMGLHTVLSEDCGTISGGQQQRILIARAIISQPKILFFDEATSALDNITQSMVCDTLKQMNSTRIVIAHRLSTIIQCDRIIVIEAGHIAEQGSYDELMASKGVFYQLASRQLT